MQGQSRGQAGCAALLTRMSSRYDAGMITADEPLERALPAPCVPPHWSGRGQGGGSFAQGQASDGGNERPLGVAGNASIQVGVSRTFSEKKARGRGALTRRGGGVAMHWAGSGATAGRRWQSRCGAGLAAAPATHLGVPKQRLVHVARHPHRPVPEVFGRGAHHGCRGVAVRAGGQPPPTLCIVVCVFG